MARGETAVIKSCLTGLYLRGGPGGNAPRASAPRVLDSLCSNPPSLSGAPDCLRRAGFWQEASLLSAPGVLDRACQIVADNSVLTPLDDCYPPGWRTLGVSMALWSTGLCSPPLLGVVGSRQPNPLAASVAAQCSLEAAKRGWGIVTGGAWGVDAHALDAMGSLIAPRALVLHPWGLNSKDAHRLIDRWPWAKHVSACEPAAGFTSGQAMERNQLIYSAARAVVVLGPRLGAGGTWHGAVTGLKRRLCPVAVCQGSGDPRAESALGALGAQFVGDHARPLNAWLDDVASLASFGCSGPVQYGLFAQNPRLSRERPQPYRLLFGLNPA